MDKKLAKKYEGLIHSAEDWFLLYVFHDKEFQNEVASAKKVEYPNIANKYNIDISELHLYIVQSKLAGGIIPTRSKIKIMNIDTENELYLVQLPFNVSKAELNTLWDKMNILKPAHRQTRRRSIEYPELVYAIFKQRQKKLSFLKIHKLYEDNLLPGYTGPNQLSEIELRQYYNRNIPK